MKRSSGAAAVSGAVAVCAVSAQPALHASPPSLGRTGKVFMSGQVHTIVVDKIETTLKED